MLYALALLGPDAKLKEATRRFHAYLDDRNTSFLSTDIRQVGDSQLYILGCEGFQTPPLGHCLDDAAIHLLKLTLTSIH